MCVFAFEVVAIVLSTEGVKSGNIDQPRPVQIATPPPGVHALLQSQGNTTLQHKNTENIDHDAGAGTMSTRARRGRRMRLVGSVLGVDHKQEANYNKGHANERLVW